MRIQVDFSVLGKTTWHEYAMRFLFGGAITVIAGIVAKKYGPVVGGLFLACPAIFPASATLIEKHERERKERLGLHGEIRGIEAAGVDANGSALGSIGLLVFGALVWKLLPEHRVAMVLATSILAWLSVSVMLWHLRKRDHRLFTWFHRQRRAELYRSARF
jgi:hypothetical protein